MLLPYAIEYYKTKFDKIDLTEIEREWLEVCCINDKMRQFIDDNYEKTTNNNDCIHKDELLSEYQAYYKLKKKIFNSTVF